MKLKKLDINKKAIETQQKKIEKVTSKLNESNYILNNLEHKGINKYLLSHSDKKQYEKMVNNLEKNRVLYRSECRLCFQPIFSFSKSEVESALRKLNAEAEEAVEEYYRMNKKSKDKEKSNDYSL